MKIAVVVHGRFAAFDLSRALIKRGHDVTVFTNYPLWAVARFGLLPDRVHTFPLHGVLARIAGRVREMTGWSFDAWLHPMFGRWATSHLRGQNWDVIHTWSGVAEEIYRDPSLAGTLKNLMRGSAHIRTQAEILVAEQNRAGRRIDQPSQWMIGREEREYALTGRIVVLSTFAYNSFRAENVAESKLRMLPLGSDVSAFRPAVDVIEARRKRILSGAPLRVLYVGGICFRKGLVDIRRIVEEGSGRLQFRFIGPVWPEAKSFVSALANRAEFLGKKPQRELPREFEWGDVFIFPTIEDGFAVVLSQASVGGLPILTTANCCGPDLVQEGRTGWVLPVRSPQEFLDRLLWCDSHRTELADMVTTAYREFQPRDWSHVAADFEEICQSDLESALTGVNRRPKHSR